ncbi:hypothetical protein [Psychromonas aquimarina]|uniref:hypothetical protein n=1 Tax=Psychromonas aquimarina TaxID=444919 RepID=UPI0003F5CB14|nr:hypothetical protein [Psychromonas aquimarina]
MNKLFFLGVLWFSPAFAESSANADVVLPSYQVSYESDAVTVPQAIAKTSCMSVVCNKAVNADTAPQPQASTITPSTQNTAFENLGDAIYILGTMGLADNCRYQITNAQDCPD